MVCFFKGFKGSFGKRAAGKAAWLLAAAVLVAGSGMTSMAAGRYRDNIRSTGRVVFGESTTTTSDDAVFDSEDLRELADRVEALAALAR